MLTNHTSHVDEGCYRQRLFAALRAISLRRLADMASALANPPFLPSATAAGFLPSDSGVGASSLISRVATVAIMAVRAFTFTGRFSLLGLWGTHRLLLDYSVAESR
jgi:hypothetical protein